VISNIQSLNKSIFVNEMVTLVLGATTNASRYAYRAVVNLLNHGHEVIAVGNKTGEVSGVTILHQIPDNVKVDTVTLYLSAQNQKAWQEAILKLKPRRIIFNPGAENEDFANEANNMGIETMEACTLVMLSIGAY
jgi:uncharacterized protein